MLSQHSKNHSQHISMESGSGSTTALPGQRQQQQQQRQHGFQQHRRQQSTPVVLDNNSEQVPFTPEAVNSQLQPQLGGPSHRRGFSLDGRRQSTHVDQASLLDSGNNGTVSITNLGQQPQQQNLQVTQQQHQALPGNFHQQHVQNVQPVQHYEGGGVTTFQLTEEEFRLFQHRQLDAQIDSLIRGAQTSQYGGSNGDQHAIKIERSRSNPEAYGGMAFVTAPQDRTRFHISPEPIDSAPSSTSQKSSPQYIYERPRSSRSDGGKFERLQSQHQSLLQQQQSISSRYQRPCTPPNQTNSKHSPMTPAQTPYSTAANVAFYESLSRPTGNNEQRPATPSLHDPEATLRASNQSRVASSRPLSEIFGEELNVVQQQNSTSPTKSTPKRMYITRKISGGHTVGQEEIEILTDSLPSPPSTRPVRATKTYDVKALQDVSAFENTPKLCFDPLTDTSHVKLIGSLDATKSIHSSPQLTTLSSSPEVRYIKITGGSGQDGVATFAYDRNSVDIEEWQSSPMKTAYSPRSMSLNDLNLDAAVEDTGISAEEVQSYISEPDPISGKWKCMYPECGKIFGRKENIRAHVQTHLGDRQYKCLHCNKRFVRQHDLKRHSKIHSGVKPYPCQCGNSFARHDALTRHRQRGICSGGFEGVVKKVARRGRPRKERPSDDDRADKAARTRRRVEASQNYASSISGGSESSYPESPDTMMLDEDYGELAALKKEIESSQNTYSFGPNAHNSYTPPMSPYSTGNVHSPSKTESTTVMSLSSVSTPPSGASFEEDLAAALTRGMSQSASDRDDASRCTEGGNEPKEDSNNGNNVPQSYESQPGSPPGLSHSSPPSSTRIWDLDMLNSSGSSHGIQSSRQDNGLTNNGHSDTTFDFCNLDVASGVSDEMFDQFWGDFSSGPSNSSSDSKDITSSLFDDMILFSEAI